MTDRRHIEMIETLAGARRHDGAGRAAVRINDLAGLLQVPARLKSAKAAGASVSVEEHNALVDDIHALHRRLVAVAQALQARTT